MGAEIVRLHDETGGAEARVLVSQGFNLFQWSVAEGAGRREVLWAEPGFETGVKRASGSGIPIMFPFPGRISDAKFHYRGRDYELEPGDGSGNAIHGFAYTRPWRVIQQGAKSVTGEFHASVDDATILNCWPADFRIRARYELSGNRLLCDLTYENTGDGPLPCALGAHAYFRLPLAEGSPVGETVLQAPVAEQWELVDMHPTGRRLPLGDMEQLREGLKLGDRQFDTVFACEPGDSHTVRTTRVSDPRSGRSVSQSFTGDCACIVIYTPGHREAICLEPYTCVPDPFRLEAEGHTVGLQHLNPGETGQMRIEFAAE
ncbi:MAG: aldose 1-epimerase [Pirellulales bacterium]